MNARKGDLVIVEQVRWDSAIGAESVERTTYEIAVVASATRDGVVKTYRGIAWGDELLSETPVPMRRQRCYVAAKASVDMEATLRAAKAHHWPGHPNQPKAFDSLEDVRAAVVKA